MTNVWVVVTPTGWFGPYANEEDGKYGLRRLRTVGDSLGLRLRGPARVVEAEPSLFQPIKRIDLRGKSD